MATQLRPSIFEELPTEIRVTIYRNLLLAYRNKHSVPKLRVLRPECAGRYQDSLYPAVLQTKKMIHDEAAQVLYSENYFYWAMNANSKAGLCLYPGFKSTGLPRRYSSLIRQVHLTTCMAIYAYPQLLTEEIFHAYYSHLRGSIENIAKQLCLSDLRLLKVTYVTTKQLSPGVDSSDALALSQSDLCLVNKIRLSCLEPLMKLRASKFEFVYTSEPKFPDLPPPDMPARLKAAIEGPKDEAFLEYRKKVEMEGERDSEEPGSDDALFEDGDEGDSEDVNEGGSEDQDRHSDNGDDADGNVDEAVAKTVTLGLSIRTL